MDHQPSTDEHEHIPPGDARYRGFRVQEMWTFSTIDPADDQEGIISMTSGIGQMPLIASDRRRMEELKPIAQTIASMVNQQVLVRHFILTEGGEVIEP